MCEKAAVLFVPILLGRRLQLFDATWLVLCQNCIFWGDPEIETRRVSEVEDLIRGFARQRFGLRSSCPTLVLSPDKTLARCKTQFPLFSISDQNDSNNCRRLGCLDRTQ